MQALACRDGSADINIKMPVSQAGDTSQDLEVP
jgi:hypothetical protein